MTNEIAQYEPNQLTAADVRTQVNLIQEVMREVMRPGEHYGYVPGTEPKTEAEKKLRKPALFKAGAEKLCLVFRLAPSYSIVKERIGEHLEVTSTCTLVHIPSGRVFGSGMGSCSTQESKYAYRQGSRKCPACGAEAIIKGKTEYGGGWVCFARKGGCGAKFGDNEESIISQQTGRVNNDDIADQYNTALKMANKRSHVAACLNAIAASDFFTQDIVLDPEDEDQTEGDGSTKGKGAHAEREQPRAKGSAEPSKDGAGSAGQNGDATGTFKPMVDGQKNMVRARLKNAGLAEDDLTAKFGKSLNDTDEKGFAFSDWDAIQDWIIKSTKA